MLDAFRREDYVEPVFSECRYEGQGVHLPALAANSFVNAAQQAAANIHCRYSCAFLLHALAEKTEPSPNVQHLLSSKTVLPEKFIYQHLEPALCIVGRKSMLKSIPEALMNEFFFADRAHGTVTGWQESLPRPHEDEQRWIS